MGNFYRIKRISDGSYVTRAYEKVKKVRGKIIGYVPIVNFSKNASNAHNFFDFWDVKHSIRLIILLEKIKNKNKSKHITVKKIRANFEIQKLRIFIVNLTKELKEDKSKTHRFMILNKNTKKFIDDYYFGLGFMDLYYSKESGMVFRSYSGAVRVKNSIIKNYCGVSISDRKKIKGKKRKTLEDKFQIVPVVFDVTIKRKLLTEKLTCKKRK